MGCTNSFLITLPQSRMIFWQRPTQGSAKHCRFFFLTLSKINETRSSVALFTQHARRRHWVGSGVGLVGIYLATVKASEVILTDGDMSTLANLKLNLDLNKLGIENEMTRGTSNVIYMVKCKYLPWEFASESELQVTPNIVLAADVMYDPSCFPHLVRVLSILPKPKVSNIHKSQGAHNEFVDNHIDDEQRTSNGCHSIKSDDDYTDDVINAGYTNDFRAESRGGSMAYIATVIRNVDTYNYFLKLASEAHLSVVDITGKQKPLNLLPCMRSYDRSSIRFL